MQQILSPWRRQAMLCLTLIATVSSGAGQLHAYDGPPSLSFDPYVYERCESSKTVTITFTLSHAVQSADVTVMLESYDYSAEAGKDYDLTGTDYPEDDYDPVTQTVTFKAGQTTASAIITILEDD